jgi:DUF971 family protein
MGGHTLGAGNVGSERTGVMRKSHGLTALIALILCASPGMADVWDAQTDNDNTVGSTDNELVHGAVQIHDLAGTADNDYYVMGQKPYSSYEIVADGGSGDFGGFGPTLERVQPDGTTVIQASESITPGRDYARSMRWANTTSGPVTLEHARVYSPSCNVGCDGNDQYHIRFFETTTSIARFNNSGTQTTVLIVQNPTNYAVTGVVYYWSATGTLITSGALSIGPKAIAVISTNVPAPGASGSITIAHNARYGDLKGKAVALEPSTGFSFDSLMEHRPK